MNKNNKDLSHSHQSFNLIQSLFLIKEVGYTIKNYFKNYLDQYNYQTIVIEIINMEVENYLADYYYY